MALTTLALALALAAQDAPPAAPEAAGGLDVAPLAPEAPAAAAGPPAAADSVPPTAPAAPAPPDVVTRKAAKATGTLGGLSGAFTGCAAGGGAPVVGLGAGGGILYWLYTGGFVGWTPALAALGTACGMTTSVIAIPIAGSGAAVAGAVLGAQQEGRDPMPAVYGATPGLALAALSTGLSCAALSVGTCGGLGALVPAIWLGAAAIATGVAAPPCTACGAGMADIIWGEPARKPDEEPMAGTKAAAKTAMRF